MSGCAEKATQKLGLTFAVHFQWRTFRCPDGGVLGRRFGWADIKDDAIQNQPPENFGNLDDTWIREKFFKVTPDGWCSGSLRRTQIDQHDGCFCCLTVAVRWFGH